MSDSDAVGLHCLFRPYYKDVPGRDKYWAAYISIMKEIGGRPHWAKVCFVTATYLYPVVSYLGGQI